MHPTFTGATHILYSTSVLFALDLIQAGKELCGDFTVYYGVPDYVELDSGFVDGFDVTLYFSFQTAQMIFEGKCWNNFTVMLGGYNFVSEGQWIKGGAWECYKSYGRPL